MPTRPNFAYVVWTYTQAAIGSVTYAPELSAMVWKIKQLGGGKEYLMRAHFGLPSVRNGTCSNLLTCRRVTCAPHPDQCEVRDPLLYRVRHPGPLLKSRGKVRLPSASLGPLHHTGTFSESSHRMASTICVHRPKKRRRVCRPLLRRQHVPNERRGLCNLHKPAGSERRRLHARQPTAELVQSGQSQAMKRPLAARKDESARVGSERCLDSATAQCLRSYRENPCTFPSYFTRYDNRTCR